MKETENNRFENDESDKNSAEMTNSEHKKMGARSKLDQCLAALSIDFKTYQHPPLMDCKQADLLNLNRSGTRLKNLFLRDNYGRRHFLLLISPNKAVDLKRLSQQLSISRLGFASTERLDKYLGIRPGHVSFLALFNDQQQQVELLIDQQVWQNDSFQCHPLVNTETYVIEKESMLRFLDFTGHTAQIVSVPDSVKSREVAP